MTVTTDATSAKLGRDTLAVLMLAAASVGVPAVLAMWSGALTIPHNDDFDFRRVALGLLATSEVTPTGFSQMSLLGQLYFVQPFLWISGGEAWSFAASTAVLAVAGIAAAYVLVRRLLPRPLAVFSVLSLVLFPGFLVNTTSFMTDVPALAAELVCLAMGAVALDRKGGAARWRWLLGSLIAGCFAFSIREFALAAPVTVLISVGVGASGRRVPYVLAGLGVVLACGAIFIATSSLPGQRSAAFELSSRNLVHVRLAAATLGLVLSPALVLAVTRLWRSWRIVDAVFGGLLGIFLYQDEILRALTTGKVPGVLLGNLLEQVGAPGGVAVGYRPILLGSPIWEVLNAIGLFAVLVGFVVMSSRVGGWLRSGDLIHRDRLRARLSSTGGLPAVFALLYGAGLAVFGTVAPIYDRYLWPLAVPLTCLLLQPMPGGPHLAAPTVIRRAPIAVAALLTTTLAWTSMAILLNSFAFDVAGWRMGELAVRRGFPVETVDAGMSWVGYHATVSAVIGAKPSATETWYDAMWPSFHLCAMVSSSLVDVPGYRLDYADINAYRLLLFDGPQQGLYLYRVSNPGCQ
jgi:hypothetical protein